MVYWLHMQIPTKMTFIRNLVNKVSKFFPKAHQQNHKLKENMAMCSTIASLAGIPYRSTNNVIDFFHIKTQYAIDVSPLNPAIV